MKEFWNVIQMVFTAVGGWPGYFLGGYDGLLYALVVFMVVVPVTILISVWKCANRLVLNTLVVLHLPVSIRRLQGLWQKELMNPQLNCLPYSAKNMI